jgi:hypothetical protein
MNYERIINYIKQVCLNHPLVNGVGYGEISDVVSNDTGVNNFPYVFINPGTIQNTTNNANLNVNLICITQTFNNELDIVRWQSTCYQILNDVIAYINQDDTYDPLLDLTNNWTINVFKERFKDDVVGATANITFTYYSPLDNCDTEFTPTYPPVTVIDGDDTVHIVQAGGSYECLPATPPDGIAYSRPNTINANQYLVGDQGYQFANNLLPYPDPPVYPETFQTLPRTNTYDNRYYPFALLQYNNEFGNKYRWTNTAGNRGTRMNMNYSEPMFHYMNDWSGATKGYVIDHLTGLAWTAYAVNPPNGTRTTQTYLHSGQTYIRPNYTFQSFANYAHGLSGETQFSLGGYKDWRIPTLEEVMSITHWMSNAIQNSFAWSVPGWGWDFEALERYYVTLGQTGTPPRGGGAMWHSSTWGGSPNVSHTYYFQQLSPSSFVGGCLVRNHY